MKFTSTIISAFIWALIVHISQPHLNNLRFHSLNAQQDFIHKEQKEVQQPKFDLLIVGSNDIHGTAYPTVMSRKDTGEKYNYGGLIYMARIIEILKQQYNGNVLYLDAGDQFQGGVEASKQVSNGQIISDYFNHLHLQGSTLGNHEFDFGPVFLQNYLSTLNNDILDANLIDNKASQLPFKNQQKSKIYHFTIKDHQSFIDHNVSEIKIGVIGLTTKQTKSTTAGFVNNIFPQSYIFDDYTSTVLSQAQKLKQNGTHAIIILGHIGNQCNNSTEYGIWTIKNQQRNIPCEMDDQLFKLLDELPEGTVDAVVQGHRHTESHYFYKGIPIIGTVNGGYYLNSIRMRFTLKENKVIIDKDELYIEGPIPVCAKLFENTKKCKYVKPEKIAQAGNLVEWKFHGITVTADEELEKIYKTKYGKIMKKYEVEEVINQIQFPLYKDYLPNSNAGNLLVNLIASSMRRLKIDFHFVIINQGAMRTIWFPGIIRYGDVFSMFPFDSTVCSFKILGRDLKKLITIIQNGQKRFYPSWGLQQIFVKSIKNKSLSSQIHRKHRHGQEHNQFEAYTLVLTQLISTLTKAPIMDDNTYIGVTNDFLINGGDDFDKVIRARKDINIFDRKDHSLLIRDLVEEELKRRKIITEKDLLGPNNMQRFIIKENNQTTYPQAILQGI